MDIKAHVISQLIQEYKRLDPIATTTGEIILSKDTIKTRIERLTEILNRLNKQESRTDEQPGADEPL